MNLRVVCPKLLYSVHESDFSGFSRVVISENYYSSVILYLFSQFIWRFYHPEVQMSLLPALMFFF